MENAAPDNNGLAPESLPPKTTADSAAAFATFPEPSPLTQNAFGVDTPSDGDAEIPPCFANMLGDMPVQTRAFLKTIRPTVAKVRLTPRGAAARTFDFADFVFDFAVDAGELMGCGGKMRADILPGGGAPAFSIGFVAVAPQGVAVLSAQDRMLHALVERLDKMEQAAATERALARIQPQQSSGDIASMLTPLVQLMGVLKGMAPDPAQQMAAVFGALTPMMSGIVNVQQQMQKIAGPVAKPSDAQQLKEIFEVPIINKAADMGLQMVAAKLSGSSNTPAEPTPVANNAFAGAA